MNASNLTTSSDFSTISKLLAVELLKKYMNASTVKSSSDFFAISKLLTVELLKSYINVSTVKSSSDFFHNFETVSSRTSKDVHECFDC